MKFGLQWFRRRQRSLARGVLALFCAAWLQAAVVPCVMAHAAAQEPAPAAHHDHAAVVGHDHAAMAEHAADGGAAPCIYCPPSDSGHGSCDGHDCVFPHDPQVDARAGGVLSSALPVVFVLPTLASGRVAGRASIAVPEAIPRIPLSISYCRFIE